MNKKNGDGLERLLRAIFGGLPPGRVDNWCQKLLELVASLEPREAWVIERRFGLNDRSPHSLAAVAVNCPRADGTVGLNRETVRRIEKRAILRLRNHSRSRQLLKGGNNKND